MNFCNEELKIGGKKRKVHLIKNFFFKRDIIERRLIRQEKGVGYRNFKSDSSADEENESHCRTGGVALILGSQTITTLGKADCPKL